MKFEVLDDFEASLCREAARVWPEAHWDRWLQYDTVHQRKRVAWKWEDFPDRICQLMGKLLLADASWMLGLPRAVPDSMLYGAGMSDMRPGDYLRTHLDHDIHGKTFLLRRCNGILFLSECEGGELMLPGRKIEPKPGRLVLFEATDESYHGVEEVTGGVRMALSVYWYGDSTGHRRKRPNAEFTEATCSQRA